MSYEYLPLVAALGALAVMCGTYAMMVATHATPAVEHALPPSLDPTADTVSAQDVVQTKLNAPAPPGSEVWATAQFSDLGQVEDMLDQLEAHGIEEREVEVLAADRFAVRWR